MIKTDNIRICDGVDSFNCILGTLQQIVSIYDYYKIPMSDIAACFETENSNNVVLFFKGDMFFNDATENGLRYCSRTHSKSQAIFLKDYRQLDYKSFATSLAYDFFLAEFGFSPENVGKMILQALTAKYPDLNEQSNIES